MDINKISPRPWSTLTGKGIMQIVDGEGNEIATLHSIGRKGQVLPSPYNAQLLKHTPRIYETLVVLAHRIIGDEAMCEDAKFADLLMSVGDEELRWLMIRLRQQLKEIQE